MNRRQFLTRAGGGAVGLAAFPSLLTACGGSGTEVGASASSTAAAPSTTRALIEVAGDTPWWLQGNFAPVVDEVASTSLKVTGSIPEALAGLYVRNGSNSRAGTSGHWFVGDGMVHGVHLEDGQARSYANRWVHTTLFESGGGIADAGVPGADIGYSNVSAFTHNGRLFTSGEIGFPYELSPGDLSTIGVHDFAGKLDTNMTAHPKVDPETGELHFFGYGLFEPFLTYHVADAQGQLIHSAQIEVGRSTMIHDFAVTEQHLVFLLPPLVFDRDRSEAGETFLDSHVWKPQLGMRVLVLHKDRLEAPQWFELPTGFVFHIGNACEDRGVIRLDYIRSASAWNATTALKELMRGSYEPHEHPSVGLVELDLQTGRARQSLLPMVGEFPRVDPRVVGRRYTQVFAAARLDAGERPGFDGVMRLDVTSGAREVYRYGADVMVEEHVFVPQPGAGGREGEGWLIGTALDLRRQHMLFSVFDAQHLADGPIAQGELPRVMPLGLHGIFVRA